MINRDQIDRARGVSIEDMIARRGIRLKRVGRELVGPCPRCGGNDRFAIKFNEGIWNCRRCKPASIVGENIGLLMWLDGRTFEDAVELLAPAASLEDRTINRGLARRATAPATAQPAHRDNPNNVFAQQLWVESIPLPGTLGERYFIERRHLDVPDDLEHAIRWNARVNAVVARMTDAATNEPLGVHRTFLDTEGRKTERKMLGRQGIVRLRPDEHVTYGLGICEGIEDGLAVLGTWCPIWVATSAGAIVRFPVLAGIECLTVFADDDRVGLDAGNACATRWRAAGKLAVVRAPPWGLK